MMDKDLNIIWANETAERYFGREITAENVTKYIISGRCMPMRTISMHRT